MNLPFCPFLPETFLPETPSPQSQHQRLPLSTVLARLPHVLSCAAASTGTPAGPPARRLCTGQGLHCPCPLLLLQCFQSHLGKDISVLVIFVSTPSHPALFADSPRTGSNRAESSLQRPTLNHLPSPSGKTGRRLVPSMLTEPALREVSEAGAGGRLSLGRGTCHAGLLTDELFWAM